MRDADCKREENLYKLNKGYWDLYKLSDICIRIYTSYKKDTSYVIIMWTGHVFDFLLIRDDVVSFLVETLEDLNETFYVTVGGLRKSNTSCPASRKACTTSG